MNLTLKFISDEITNPIKPKSTIDFYVCSTIYAAIIKTLVYFWICKQNSRKSGNSWCIESNFKNGPVYFLTNLSFYTFCKSTGLISIESGCTILISKAVSSIFLAETTGKTRKSQIYCIF